MKFPGVYYTVEYVILYKILTATESNHNDMIKLKNIIKYIVTPAGLSKAV